MVNYLIFPSLNLALQKSRQIALSLGAGDQIGDVTQYWFGCIEHQDGRGAMEVTDESLLTDTEKLELKDNAYMQNDGWINF